MSTQLALKDQKTGAELVPPTTAEDQFALMLERFARDPSVDPEKIDKFLAMKERVDARRAEQSFNAAMVEAQSQIRPVLVDSSNSQTHSKYASYEALDKAIRPVYTRNGFALSFDTGEAPENAVRVLCYVSHRDGHSRTYQCLMAADGKGAKGNDVMTRTHATGAALTYGRRYLLGLIFNVAITEDYDGNDAADNSGVISEHEAQHVRDLIEKTGSDIERFCKYFKIEAVTELRKKDYGRAIESLNTKAGKK